MFSLCVGLSVYTRVCVCVCVFMYVKENRKTYKKFYSYKKQYPQMNLLSQLRSPQGCLEIYRRGSDQSLATPTGSSV